jgi:hypothetical protein
VVGSEVEPHGMADNLNREAMILILYEGVMVFMQQEYVMPGVSHQQVNNAVTTTSGGM